MKNVFFSSLRNSLITLALIAVLPALAVILHSSLENRDRAIKAAEAEALRVVQFVAGEQQLITMRAEQLLSLLAQMPQVKAQDAQGAGGILRRLKSRSSVFSNIVAADELGRVFASGVPLSGQPVLKGGRKLIEGLDEGEFAVGDFNLQLPGAPAVPQIHFVHSVAGADGQVRGVLVTALRPDRFERVFNVASLPPGSVLSIADQNGTRLFRYPASQDGAPTGQKVVAELWDLISGPAPMAAATVTLADGVRRVMAYKQLRITPESKPYLYISVGIPESQALAGAVEALYRDLSYLAGAAILAVLVAWLVGGVVITRPVERLTRIASRLGAGDLDARSGSPEDFGELSLLAKTMDDMATALSEDISAREAAETELRKSEALLRMILEGLPVGVWMSDPAGRILYVNQASRRIWGGAPGQEPSAGPGAGASPRAWRHETGEPMRPEEFVLPMVIAGHAPEPQVLEVEAPDGGRCVVRCAGIPVCDDEGNLRAAIVVLEDITERIQREQARESVEHIMRHDLRSPLVGFISLPLLLLRQPNLTDEQRQWLSRLHGSANTMLRIIDAYLKLSRIERGCLALEPVRTDLHALVLGVRESLAQQFPGVPVAVTLDGQPAQAGSELPILCEETLCAALFSNLIKNALEASPEGGIVEVDLRDEGGTVSVAIANQGEVPEAIRPRFFEKYVTAAKKNGTGLGTYAARRIAEFHGGGVSLDASVPGRTRITVQLPKTPQTKAPLR